MTLFVLIKQILLYLLVNYTYYLRLFIYNLSNLVTNSYKICAC